MSPKVSVLIVSYNVKEYVDHAIDSLMRSSVDNLDIVVVDNNSFDSTVDHLNKSYPDVTVIANKENVGFGKAVNQATSVAKGDYFLILNPDTVVQENTIDILLHYMELNEKVGMVGPKILNSDGTLQAACKRSFPSLNVAVPKLLGLDKLFPKSKWAGKYNLSYLDPDQVSPVDAISGSCMFIRKELFQDLNGFDEHFFMFGEDLDLCYRTWEKGYEVHYVPKTQIVHYQGESVKSAPFDSINAFYNAMILFADKHFSTSQGFLTKWAIRFGISIRKFMTVMGELRSQILSVFFDAVVVAGAFMIAIPFKFDHFEPIVLSGGLVPVVYILFWIAVGSLFQLYSRYILSYTRAILSSLTGFFLAVAFTYFFKQYAFSRLVIIMATVIITLFIPGWRVLVHYLMSRGFLRPIKEKHNILFTRKTIIIGSDGEGTRIANHIIKRFDTGLDIVGFVDSHPRQDDLPVPFLGSLTDLQGIVNTNSIRELIFSNTAFSNKEILNIMDTTKAMRLTYRMVPRHQDILLGKASIEEIGEYSFVNIEYTLFNRIHAVTKRIFDTFVSSTLLILFSPIIFLRSLGSLPVKVEFWGQDNSRFYGRIFNSKSGFIHNLPLLWSVVTGKMSLVGSSLILTDEKDPELICMPGLTGLERLRNVKFTEQDRRLLDHYYVQNQSLSFDIEILVKTVFNG
ncbi:MAG: glycosyltransferase [Candidatus Marinimicrobia bacterium]|nr:glycosyltransferase [Candidatus Neomarinimicrobiota bacterium]